jgi:hypothetical protein
MPDIPEMAAKFGPFANVATIAGILVALFAWLLPRTIGRLQQWTWLAGDSPSFLVAAGARVVAIVVMGLSWVFMTKSNYQVFVVVALAIAVFCAITIVRFDRDRKLYVVSIPETGKDGTQLVQKGKRVFKSVVIGRESEMRPQAAADYAAAQQQGGAMSLQKFMGGYGTSINDPGALWDAETLATHSTSLTSSLILIALSAVVAVFLVSLALDLAGFI